MHLIFRHEKEGEFIPVVHTATNNNKIQRIHLTQKFAVTVSNIHFTSEIMLLRDILFKRL